MTFDSSINVRSSYQPNDATSKAAGVLSEEVKALLQVVNPEVLPDLIKSYDPVKNPAMRDLVRDSIEAIKARLYVENSPLNLKIRDIESRIDDLQKEGSDESKE